MSIFRMAYALLLDYACLLCSVLNFVNSSWAIAVSWSLSMAGLFLHVVVPSVVITCLTCVNYIFS